MKFARVAEHLKGKHGMTFSVDESLVTMLTQQCLSRDTGARGIDAHINQQVLPMIAREILARRTSGEAAQRIGLALSQDGLLTIDVVAGGVPAPRVAGINPVS